MTDPENMQVLGLCLTNITSVVYSTSLEEALKYKQKARQKMQNRSGLYIFRWWDFLDAGSSHFKAHQERQACVIL